MKAGGMHELTAWEAEHLQPFNAWDPNRIGSWLMKHFLHYLLTFKLLITQIIKILTTILIVMNLVAGIYYKFIIDMLNSTDFWSFLKWLMLNTVIVYNNIDLLEIKLNKLDSVLVKNYHYLLVTLHRRHL